MYENIAIKSVLLLLGIAMCACSQSAVNYGE